MNRTTSRPGDEPMVLVTRAGGLQRIVLNRPCRRNALHPEQLRTLTSAINHAGADGTLSTVLIEGAGTLAFSAGFDLEVLAAAGRGSSSPAAPLWDTVAALHACPKVTIALVRGYCLGAGFELAMACDFRIGTADARFGVPAVNLGIVYEPRAVDRLQRLLGPTVAKEILLLGRQIDAERALATGILQEVIPADGTDAAIERWVGEPSEAAEAHKRMIAVLAAAEERPEEVWKPLDVLRTRSLDSPVREREMRAFMASDTGDGAPSPTG